MMRAALIHPDDYGVNQVELIFKVSEVPIRVAEDGDFDCLVPSAFRRRVNGQGSSMNCANIAAWSRPAVTPALRR